MMTSPNITLFIIFDLKMVDLRMVTINFDSLFHRLLGSTAETNYTAVGSRPWRTRPCKNHLSYVNSRPARPSRTCSYFFWLQFSDYNFLFAASLCRRLPAAWALTQQRSMKRKVSWSVRPQGHFGSWVPGRQTHNQPQKKQETQNQAHARATTLRAASPCRDKWYVNY